MSEEKELVKEVRELRKLIKRGIIVYVLFWTVVSAILHILIKLGFKIFGGG